MGPDVMIFVFWMLSFKPNFSLSSFTFIKRLFSSSSFSVIRVMSSAYLRLLILLPAILIPAYALSSPVLLMMYSAYKLNKQGDNIQPCHTPFPIWNQSMSSFNCCFLTCIQVSQEAGWVVWCSHLFQNFPQFVVIHTVKDFPSGSDGKVSDYNVGDPGLIPGLGRSSRGGNGNPPQYSCLENPMDREAR